MAIFLKVDFELGRRWPINFGNLGAGLPDFLKNYDTKPIFIKNRFQGFKFFFAKTVNSSFGSKAFEMKAGVNARF